MGTLVAIFWLFAGPAEDLSALCDRLTDRASNSVEEIVRRVAAGEADPAAVAERARALRGHPQAFVRRRAAEALLAVATEEGALWLRAELLLYRSWCRMDTIDCTGEKGGFPGRVERLLRKAGGAVEPDPWNTPPVAVPPEAFRAVVCPVPWEKGPTWRVFLLNATSGPFVRATEDRAATSFRWSRPRNVGGGAGGSFPHGAHRLRKVPPGGLAFRWDVTLAPGDLADLEAVELRFGAPDFEHGINVTVVLPAELFRRGRDLDAFREGLCSPERCVRDLMLARLREPGVAERLPPEDRAAALAALLEVPRVPGMEDRLGESLIALKSAWDPPTVARIAAIDSPAAPRCLAAAPDELRRAVLVAACRWEDPVVIGNAAAVLAREDAPAGDFPEEAGRAARRWIASGDPRVRRAGLAVAARWRLAVPLEEAKLVEAMEGSDDAVKLAALDALAAGGIAMDPKAARAFALARLRAEPAPSAAVVRRLEQVYLLVPPAPGDEAEILGLYRGTSGDGFLGALLDLGHERNFPALARLRGEPALADLVAAALPALLAGELARPTPDPWEERYTEDLLTAVLTGNDAVVARACLPLAFGEGAASGRALELATGVLDAAAASAAARCLALRSDSGVK